MPEVRHTPQAPTQARRLAAGAAIHAHRHDNHQLVYAARGVLAVTTGADWWVAPANRLVWVPAGTVHAHRAHGELELHLVGLPLAANPLRLTTPTLLTAEPLTRELIRTYTVEPGPDTPRRRRLRAVLLDRLRPAAQQPIHLPTATDPRLVEVCDLLRADPADPRGLAQLGREVGAAERTLSRLFRAELGMTFPQWRTQLRLYRAQVLLARQLSVSAVAHRCGWSSTSAFIDAYRRSFGHTPGAR